MMTVIGILLIVFRILVIVDAESLIFRPQNRSLLDEAFVDCSAAFHAESLHVEGVPSAARLGLVHRLGPCSPLRSTIPFDSEFELTKDMLVHEANRVRFLQSKLEASVWGASKVGATQAPLVSGSSIGAANYLITVGLGTPAKDLMLAIDTGSEITWTQCAPCASQTACYSQASAIFDPKGSSTYQVLPCGGPVCTSLASQSGGCAGGVCQYQVDYLDKSFTKGDFSTDTLSVGGTMVAGFQFGCGHDNEGLFNGSDGLMGLDRGSKAFPAQTSAIFGQNFAYCLPSPFTKSAGFIEFGSSAAPSATHTPLLPVSTSLYVAGLSSVTVGTTSITSSTGSVYLIVDSGTVISRFKPTLYNDLRDAFKAGVSGLTPAPVPAPFGVVFDTCFTSSSSTVLIPNITFNLGGGATFSPPSNSLLYPVGSGTSCLAFAAIQPDIDFSILGNFQQQGFRFAFDIASNILSVDPTAC